MSIDEHLHVYTYSKRNLRSRDLSLSLSLSLSLVQTKITKAEVDLRISEARKCNTLREF